MSENTQDGCDWRDAWRDDLWHLRERHTGYKDAHDRIATFIEQQQAALSTANEQVKVLEAALGEVLMRMPQDERDRLATEASFATIFTRHEKRRSPTMMPPLHAPVGEYREGDTPTAAAAHEAVKESAMG